MRVLSFRQLRGYSAPLMYGDAAMPTEDVALQVRPSAGTAAAGLGFFVLAGILTHVAVRLVDRWFFE